MPAIIVIVLILLATVFFPQAERIVFQDVPTYYNQASNQVSDALNTDADIIGSIREVTSGARPIGDVIGGSAGTQSEIVSEQSQTHTSVSIDAQIQPVPMSNTTAPDPSFTVPDTQDVQPVMVPQQPTTARSEYSVTIPDQQFGVPDTSTGFGAESAENGTITGMFELAENAWQSVVNLMLTILPYSLVISFLFLIGIIYTWGKFIKMRNDDFASFVSVPYPDFMRPQGSIPAAQVEENTKRPGETRWEKIVNASLSENPNDWRIAILDADILLDDLVTAQGYKGETLADKLKQIEKADFHTLDQAWEAHKVRNKVAHEGINGIDEHEVRRVIGLFQQVFEEFKFI